MKNYFISVGGVDCPTKTLTLELIENYFKKNKIDYVFSKGYEESEIARKIGEISVDTETERLNEAAKMLLYYARKAQYINTVIKPALQQGKAVICENFIATTKTFIKNGFSEDYIENNEENFSFMDKWVSGDEELEEYAIPSLTLVFEKDFLVKSAFTKNVEPFTATLCEAIEKHETFFWELRYRYISLISYEEGFRIIDANQSIDDIWVYVEKELNEIYFGEKK